MKNTTKVFLGTTLLGLGCLGSAYAMPHQPCHGMPGMKAEIVSSQNEAMQRMLTLTDKQKGAFAKYAAARDAYVKEMKKLREGFKVKPAVDYQGRLEAKAKRHAAMGAVLENLAQARAEFAATLDASQKLVLETMEADRGFGLARPHARPHGPHGMHAMHKKHPIPYGAKPMPFRGPHKPA